MADMEEQELRGTCRGAAAGSPQADMREQDRVYVWDVAYHGQRETFCWCHATHQTLQLSLWGKRIDTRLRRSRPVYTTWFTHRSGEARPTHTVDYALRSKIPTEHPPRDNRPEAAMVATRDPARVVRPTHQTAQE